MEELLNGIRTNYKMRKIYSKDDLIRKKTTRLIVWGLSLFMIIIGSKHIVYNGLNWEGALVGLFGVLLSAMLLNAQEKLLKEDSPKA